MSPTGGEEYSLSEAGGDPSAFSFLHTSSISLAPAELALGGVPQGGVRSRVRGPAPCAETYIDPRMYLQINTRFGGCTALDIYTPSIRLMPGNPLPYMLVCCSLKPPGDDTNIIP